MQGGLAVRDLRIAPYPQASILTRVSLSPSFEYKIDGVDQKFGRAAGIRRSAPAGAGVIGRKSSISRSRPITTDQCNVVFLTAQPGLACASSKLRLLHFARWRTCRSLPI